SAETALVLGLLALAAGSYHGLSPKRRRVLVCVVASAAVGAFLGAALLSAGVDAGGLLLVAAVVAGGAPLWFLRLSSGRWRASPCRGSLAPPPGGRAHCARGGRA